MRVFNEEYDKKPKHILLMVNAKDVKNLIDIAEEACKVRPRKTSWKRLLRILETSSTILFCSVF